MKLKILNTICSASLSVCLESFVFFYVATPYGDQSLFLNIIFFSVFKYPMFADDADYDAFIIFNHNDQKWVQETLLQILEKESHYKCCVHYRDFAPGEEFVVNMTESVRKSKKVIAVISKTFFSSHWCNFELQQAIYQHIKKGNNGVIVIKIDSVSTEMFPKAIQTKSFIDYSNRVERPFFKSRLLNALESSSNAYKKDLITMQTVAGSSHGSAHVQAV